MKVELTQEDIQNLIVFINAYSAQGQAQEVAVMLKAKLTGALQAEPSRDGKKAPPPEVPVG